MRLITRRTANGRTAKLAALGARTPRRWRQRITSLLAVPVVLPTVAVGR